MLCGGRVDLAKERSLSSRWFAEFLLIEAPGRAAGGTPITHMYSCVIPPAHAGASALLAAHSQACMGGA